MQKKKLPKPESQTDDDDVLEGSGEREGDKESSVFMDTVSDVPDDSEILEGEKECFIFKEIHTDVHEDNEKTEVYTECSISKENTHEDGVERRKEGESVYMNSDSSNSVFYDYEEKSEVENEGYVFIETNSNVHIDCKKNVEDETEKHVFVGNGCDAQHGSISIKQQEEEETGDHVHEDTKNVEEVERESFVFVVHEDDKKIDEEKEEGPIFVETNTATTTSMCQYMSGKDVISGFIEQPTAMSFSFREFFMSPSVSPVSNNACVITDIIHNKVFPEIDTEKNLIALEEKEKLFQFKSNGFVESDSESESESSTSSGLIWGNKFEDSFGYQFLAGNEGFESELFKLVMKDERTEVVVEEKQFSCSGKVSADTYIEMESGVEELKSLNGYSFRDEDQHEGSYNEEVTYMNQKSEESRWEEKLCESEHDEENEKDYEWEHDDLVGQLKMELKNARQGGLATILEEEENEEEEDLEVESPKVVLDLKPLKIEEKLEYKEQVDEIEHVYRSYAEKMKKLDILNYQTMHALGLLQLKDPLKLISVPTIQGAKPLISQNVWPCKASKNTSDPILKIVNELHRDLELVYIGQVCLSWEILCWQHKKAQELQQFHSQGYR
ncbi:putative ribosomal protein L34Ae [Lupinus albus]|uniref:Putative ribosomal protein L34Ae n=1 Tax=Lupinus albus TaxID=3870 RepID=A0A6A4PW67_LUPAL|nr:putative ribosomal protein L34Ae [Lupinus albus]